MPRLKKSSTLNLDPCTTCPTLDMNTLSVVDLIEQIITKTENIQISDALKLDEVTELSTRLELPQIQTLLLSIFVKFADDNCIYTKKLARHFDISTISIVKYIKDINELVQKEIIQRCKDHEGNYHFRVPQNTLIMLSEDKLPKTESIENLSVENFIAHLRKSMKMLSENTIDDDELETKLKQLIQSNLHLNLVSQLKDLKLNFEDLKLFIAMSFCYIDDMDDQISHYDISEYYNDSNQAKRILWRLSDPHHPLRSNNLVESSCDEGKVMPNRWMLTSNCKQNFYADLQLVNKETVFSNLKDPQKIIEKKLFYNNNMQKMIGNLYSLFDNERMDKIMKCLENKGFRKGLTSLFYGGPGTGKTETVFQLARATGRSIMQVDIPSIRSKWVGETEKNIQNVFDRYASIVQKTEIAPILLFNEADAIFSTRNEGNHSVDKMENAMQNIILQEMEKFEGILIATTNLETNMDPAFERRFLYKLEFDKPTADERCHIWRAMIPELSDDAAHELAKRFDFSGGQIENIARKCVINSILNNHDEIDMNELIDSCNAEKLDKHQTHKLGFVA